MDGRANQIDAGGNQRIEDVVEWIAERRREQHRPGGSRLMVVVDDLREPLLVEDAVHVDRLGLAREVEVAIVVVADVLLVGPWEPGQRAQRRFALAHVPVRDQFMTVRVGVDRQHDDIAEEPERFRVRAADQLIHGLDELLRTQHLAGVQPAIDPDDCLSFGRERACLIVGQAFSQRQPAGNISIAIDLFEVVRATR